MAKNELRWSGAVKVKFRIGDLVEILPQSAKGLSYYRLNSKFYSYVDDASADRVHHDHIGKFAIILEILPASVIWNCENVQKASLEPPEHRLNEDEDSAFIAFCDHSMIYGYFDEAKKIA